jgi:hypothetical protein
MGAPGLQGGRPPTRRTVAQASVVVAVAGVAAVDGAALAAARRGPPGYGLLAVVAPAPAAPGAPAHPAPVRQLRLHLAHDVGRQAAVATGGGAAAAAAAAAACATVRRGSRGRSIGEQVARPDRRQAVPQEAQGPLQGAAHRRGVRLRVASCRRKVSNVAWDCQLRRASSPGSDLGSIAGAGDDAQRDEQPEHQIDGELHDRSVALRPRAKPRSRCSLQKKRAATPPPRAVGSTLGIIGSTPLGTRRSQADASRQLQPTIAKRTRAAVPCCAAVRLMCSICERSHRRHRLASTTRLPRRRMPVAQMLTSRRCADRASRYRGYPVLLTPIYLGVMRGRGTQPYPSAPGRTCQIETLPPPENKLLPSALRHP